MDAPFDGYNGDTAILSQFPSRLLNPTYAHVTSVIQTLVLGPEMGWSNEHEGFAMRRRMMSIANCHLSHYDCETAAKCRTMTAKCRTMTAECRFGY